jgi:hypothetical protein
MGNADSNKGNEELKELSLDDLKHVAGGVGSDPKIKPLSTNGGSGLSESGGDDTPGPLPGN